MNNPTVQQMVRKIYGLNNVFYEKKNRIWTRLPLITLQGAEPFPLSASYFSEIVPVH
jgi:hypothetical protein